MAVLQIDAADAAGLAAPERADPDRRPAPLGADRAATARLKRRRLQKDEAPGVAAGRDEGTQERGSGDCAIAAPALLRSIQIVVADVAELVRQRVTGGAA